MSDRLELSTVPPNDAVRPEPKTPPKWLFRYLINPAMRALLRSRFHRPVSNHLLLLTFRGRKSGRRFTIPVGYHDVGDGLITLHTESPWWTNLRHDAPVELRLRGEDVRGAAEATDDVDVVLPAARSLLRQYGVKRARRVGIHLDDTSREPTDEELREAIRRQGLAVIKIRPLGGEA